jgi:hypothetical protein
VVGGALRGAAAGDATPDDLDEEPLVCGALTEDAAGEGDACEEASDCARGLCLLSGACSRACSSATDCEDDERCQAVFARREREVLTMLSACVSAIDVPDGVEVMRELRSDAIAPGENTIELPPAAPDATTLFVLEH